MGFSLTATKSDIKLRGGAVGFFNMRCNIALAYDKEFGEHYKTLPIYASKEECDAWDAKLNAILADDRFKEEDGDIIDFLFIPDCEGSISPKTCGKLYRIIKDVDFGGKIFTYAAHSDGKDYEHLKELLKQCWKKRWKLWWC